MHRSKNRGQQDDDPIHPGKVQHSTLTESGRENVPRLRRTAAGLTHTSSLSKPYLQNSQGKPIGRKAGWVNHSALLAGRARCPPHKRLGQQESHLTGVAYAASIAGG
ncbi:hypothetical protein [Egbenema bharatensis]|uniref:hypothetical protein n=1 Tax=Egbenema bharatensis TaxID=3463334 RepID=UPI003A8672F4